MQSKPPTTATPKRGVRARVRAHYDSLVPYVSIVPTDVLSEQGGVASEDIIKLDGNENPYGPSPRVLEALRRFDAWHIYPDPDHRVLRAKLSEYGGVGPEHIIAGSGSDEIIDLLMRVFLEPGESVINCPPTFGMYPFSTQVNAGALTSVPRRADFSLDLPATVAAASAPQAKLIFLASPNNPTGNPLQAHELMALLDTGIIVIVDEAYQEFSPQPSFVSLAPEHENLIVLRTFSKWAGLAGLRVGYGIMAPELVQLLDQVKPPYNVNVAGLAAAEAALDDREAQLLVVQRLIAERARLSLRLREVSYLEPLPSAANFVLCRVQGKDSAVIKSKLEQKGIFIKRIDDPHLPSAIRISVGKPEHTDAVIAALQELE